MTTRTLSKLFRCFVIPAAFSIAIYLGGVHLTEWVNNPYTPYFRAYLAGGCVMFGLIYSALERIAWGVGRR